MQLIFSILCLAWSSLFGEDIAVRNKNIGILVSATAIFILVGLNVWNPDRSNYGYVYENINSATLSSEYEAGYMLLYEQANNLNLTFEQFSIIFGLAIAFIYVWLATHITSKPTLLTAAYLLCPLWPNIAQSRMHLSVLLGSIGMVYIFKGRRSVGIASILLASQFHTSALFYLLAVPANTFSLLKYSNYILLCPPVSIAVSVLLSDQTEKVRNLVLRFRLRSYDQMFNDDLVLVTWVLVLPIYAITGILIKKYYNQQRALAHRNPRFLKSTDTQAIIANCLVVIYISFPLLTITRDFIRIPINGTVFIYAFLIEMYYPRTTNSSPKTIGITNRLKITIGLMSVPLLIFTYIFVMPSRGLELDRIQTTFNSNYLNPFFQVDTVTFLED